MRTAGEETQRARQAMAEAEEARNKAQSGAQVVGQLVESISQVQAQAQGLKEDMSVLGKQAEDIGRIMNVITDWP